MYLFSTLILLSACGEKDTDATPRAGDTAAQTDDTGLTGDGSGDDGSGDDGSGDDGSGDGGGDDGGGGIPYDESLFNELLAGTRSPDSVLYDVSVSDGWPIAGSQGYIFLLQDSGGGPWYLAGDHNGWALDPMNKGSGYYWLVADVPDPEGSLYKFVDGRKRYSADPYARAYGYDDYGEYSLVLGGGAHIERWPWIGDGVVEARTLRVWVPPEPMTHQVYVHDGQNLFDPDAIWGGWRLQESLGPSTMAIGLDNSEAYRIDDYTHVTDFIYGDWYGGGGDDYADYVEQTVRPLIEGRYGAAPVVGVMGSSLGGLISLHQALRYPDAYDFVASMSGTVGWGSIGATNETIIERSADAGHGSAVIYLDSGGSEGEGCEDRDGDGIEDDAIGASDNYCENLQLVGTLEDAGYEWEVDLYHWWEPDADHNESEWAARVWIPLSILESL